MGKGNPVGMEGLPGHFLEAAADGLIGNIHDFPGISINLVPHHGIPQGGQMDPDLMGPPRFDSYVKEGSHAISFPDLPAGNGAFPLAALRRHLLSLDGMPPHRQVDNSFIIRNIPINQGQVMLFHLPGLEMFRQGPMNLIGFGHNHESRGVFVEAMDNAGPEDAADSREIMAVVKKGIDEGALTIARPGMNHQSGLFVDHQEERILINHF